MKCTFNILYILIKNNKGTLQTYEKALWIPLLVILVLALGFGANYFLGSEKVNTIIERADSSMEKEDYKRANDLYAEASELKQDKKTDDLKTLSKEMNRLNDMKKQKHQRLH
ncbi:hypothetical protein ACTIGL_22050 [Bacillus shihchuchen]|uniref:Uncharacterized protein n=1 Tax=Bacillus shihchuchen TaxID=3036942 RepID=A0ABT7KXK2_9BACI|nr:hypothetical protein [Bacillus shihchuchen]